MRPEETSVYTSPGKYLSGPEGMRNEVTMWNVAAGLFMQELVRKYKGIGFGGLQTDIGLEIKNDLGPVSVLDICCGPGNFANYLGLVYSNLQVTGVDTNPAFIDEAARRFGRYGWKFLNADARDLDLGEKFEFILASSAYHHMADGDKPVFLRSVRKHLKEGGKVIVCENFLPAYGDESQRDRAVHRYYTLLKSYYAAGNGTEEAIEVIEEVYQLELSGNEEHKVCCRIFREHVAEAGFAVEADIPVWQPEEFKADHAGSHVILLSLA